MSDLETKSPEPLLEDGDHDRFAHYVDKRRYDITAALVEGTPVMALCGKFWVPTRDPERYPICPECESIHKLITGWNKSDD